MITTFAVLGLGHPSGASGAFRQDHLLRQLSGSLCFNGSFAELLPSHFSCNEQPRSVNIPDLWEPRLANSIENDGGFVQKVLA